MEELIKHGGWGQGLLGCGQQAGLGAWSVWGVQAGAKGSSALHGWEQEMHDSSWLYRSPEHEGPSGGPAQVLDTTVQSLLDTSCWRPALVTWVPRWQKQEWGREGQAGPLPVPPSTWALCSCVAL